MLKDLCALWGQTPCVRELMPLAEHLPPIISRKHIDRYMGGLVTAKTLANHDARGTGPRVRIETSYGVVYPTLFLLEWIEQKGMHVVAQSAAKTEK